MNQSFEPKGNRRRRFNTSRKRSDSLRRRYKIFKRNEGKRARDLVVHEVTKTTLLLSPLLGKGVLVSFIRCRARCLAVHHSSTRTSIPPKHGAESEDLGFVYAAEREGAMIGSVATYFFWYFECGHKLRYNFA